MHTDGSERRDRREPLNRPLAMWINFDNKLPLEFWSIRYKRGRQVRRHVYNVTSADVVIMSGKTWHRTARPSFMTRRFFDKTNRGDRRYVEPSQMGGSGLPPEKSQKIRQERQDEYNKSSESVLLWNFSDEPPTQYFYRVSINIGVNRDTDLPVFYVQTLSKDILSNCEKEGSKDKRAIPDPPLDDDRKVAARKYALSATKSTDVKNEDKSSGDNFTYINQSVDDDDADDDSQDKDYIPGDSD
jgi:hypothetical protein